jgi:hypothetical protein
MDRAVRYRDRLHRDGLIWSQIPAFRQRTNRL